MSILLLTITVYYACVVIPKLCIENSDNTVESFHRCQPEQSFHLRGIWRQDTQAEGCSGMLTEGWIEVFGRRWGRRVAMLRCRLICCSSTWPSAFGGHCVRCFRLLPVLDPSRGGHAPLVLLSLYRSLFYFRITSRFNHGDASIRRSVLNTT